LHPPYTRPAPLHRAPLLTPFDFVCTGIFSVLEFPVTVVPLGFDRGGLPVGVQIAGRRGNDHLTMAVAAALEQDFGGWVCAEPRSDNRLAALGRAVGSLWSGARPKARSA
jgi:fatty acid amide hydrolase 2